MSTLQTTDKRRRIIVIENCGKKVIRFLLENGADVKAVDEAGRTPLSVALAMGLTAVIGLLRDYGAETKTEDDIKKEVTKP